MNWQLFSAFLVITSILIIVPGPVVTLVIATGAQRGIRPALATVVGTMIGTAVLLAGIGLGLSWLLKMSSELFEIMRWAGAAYLFWLGIQAWRHAGAPVAKLEPRNHVYMVRGFIVAVTNPKTIAFFTAFLSQFIDPTLPVGFQITVMSLASLLIALVFDSAWAIGAGLGRQWFLKPHHNKLLGRISGLVLMGGGVWLSLTRRPG
ncbi:MAG: LysE family translocator [Proteobacteria bacterium]|nr:LysE family translocator [Pseudomonadota bacterium]